MLIESSGGGRPSDERFNNTEQMLMTRKGEITLKAVKMSRIVNQNGQTTAASSSGEQHLVYQHGANHHTGQQATSSLIATTDSIEPI